MAQILLAEDDASMRQFLKLALEKAGHSVTAAEDGLAALKCLEDQTPFDMLLADIVMPGMDGIELSHRAASLRPGLKVMFITGFSAVALSQKGLAPDTAPTAPKVLSKPFHLSQLVAQVNDLLAEAASGQA